MIKKKILLVVANYYQDIADDLIKGASQYLEDKSILGDSDIHIDYSIHKVPGAFEIPFMISHSSNLYDGFVALGCIIKGQTYQFEVISNEVTRKLMDLSIDIDKPIGLGILTCQNKEQAKERSDPTKGNKGAEATRGCISSMFLPFINA